MILNGRNCTRSSRFAAAAAVAFFLAETLSSLAASFTIGTARDYLALASASRVLRAGSRCVYCMPTLARAQGGLLGFQPHISSAFPVLYVYPPLAAWLAQPVADLPLQQGADIFIALNLVAMIASAALVARRLRASGSPCFAIAVAIAAVFSIQGDATLLLGQSDGILLLCALCGLSAMERRRPVACGLLMTPLLFKLQFVWLLFPALMITRQWRVLAALAAGVALLAMSGLALAGTQSLGDFARLVNTPTGVAQLSLQGSSVPVLVDHPVSWLSYLLFYASRTLPV